jgi:transcriptional regulator with XRE-family HTH domain
MSIGDKIREYRLLRGMTQQDIADALGESSGRVVYNWEKGIGRPDCEKIARLCELLDVSADELSGC